MSMRKVTPAIRLDPVDTECAEQPDLRAPWKCDDTGLAEQKAAMRAFSLDSFVDPTQTG